MYSEYVCHVLERSRYRIKSGRAKFRIILSDCMKIEPFLLTDVKYDRILTSNLIDSIPIGNILRSFKPHLNRSNDCAAIVTETINWLPTIFRSKFDLFQRVISYPGSALGKAATKDSKNPGIASSGGRTGHMEYLDLTEEFETYLKASLLACDSQTELCKENRVSLPSVTTLAASYGLECRKFLRNENSIMPFRWPVNCRRVTMIRGMERAVEWVLLCGTESKE